MGIANYISFRTSSGRIHFCKTISDTIRMISFRCFFISDESTSFFSLRSSHAFALNDAYYQALMDGREIMRGISVLKPEWIIPFKAKAWLDLREKKDVDSSDIKKHRNDIIRIVSDMVLQKCILP